MVTTHVLDSIATCVLLRIFSPGRSQIHQRFRELTGQLFRLERRIQLFAAIQAIYSRYAMNDLQSSNIANMIYQWLGFSLLSVPDERCLATTEAGLDGLIQSCTSAQQRLNQPGVDKAHMRLIQLFSP
jgi:hypothetical protein